jgi:hypothetical protein
VARFGVQKSDIHHKEDTYGYVFGNVTLVHHNKDQKRPLKSAALVLVNRNLFLKIYGLYNEYKNEDKIIKNNKTSNNLCRRIFDVIDSVAYDEKCNAANQLDTIRYVPCIEGALCDGAFHTQQIVQNYQFTYVIEDQKQPTYLILYISFFFFKLYIHLHKNF